MGLLGLTLKPTYGYERIYKNTTSSVNIIEYFSFIYDPFDGAPRGALEGFIPE